MIETHNMLYRIVILSILLVACGDAEDRKINTSETTSTQTIASCDVGSKCIDGEELSESCRNLGFESGELGCQECEYDTSQCVVFKTCGNGELDISETCEGFELRDQSCATKRFEEGQLRCTSECTLDVSDCSTCGDGILHDSEVCDSNNFGGKTCQSEKGPDYRGSLSCTDDCTGFSTEKCFIAFSQIDTGLEHNCGIKLDGKVICWG